LITVFGGGGFIGRHVCEALLKTGARVLVAQRDIRSAHAVQTLGQVGQVGFMAANIRSKASIAHAVKGADAVINLVGAFSDMDALHVDGAGAIARAAAAAGAGALVHVSAIGADVESESNYGRTKGRGEAAVRKAFPGATIIRPSLVFGPGDQLTNRFAGMGRLPVVPVLKPKTKFQPVFVADLGKAIARAALDPAAHGGKIYEIGGPEVMSFVDLQRAIFALAGQSPDVIELPDFAGDLMSRFGFLPGAPLTRDQWLMLGRDNIASKKASGLEAFGIEPTPLAAVAGEWLGRFRSGGRFAGRRAPLANA
jgi:NADH dehydrogenase